MQIVVYSWCKLSYKQIKMHYRFVSTNTSTKLENHNIDIIDGKNPAVILVIYIDFVDNNSTDLQHK